MKEAGGYDKKITVSEFLLLNSCGLAGKIHIAGFHFPDPQNSCLDYVALTILWQLSVLVHQVILALCFLGIS